MAVAMITIGTIVGIIVVQTVIQGFYHTNLVETANYGPLNNVSTGTYSLTLLFTLLLAVGAVLALIRFAF